MCASPLRSLSDELAADDHRFLVAARRLDDAVDAFVDAWQPHVARVHSEWLPTLHGLDDDTYNAVMAATGFDQAWNLLLDVGVKLDRLMSGPACGGPEPGVLAPGLWAGVAAGIARSGSVEAWVADTAAAGDRDGAA